MELLAGEIGEHQLHILADRGLIAEDVDAKFLN